MSLTPPHFIASFNRVHLTASHSCTLHRPGLIVSVSPTRNPATLAILYVSTNGFFTCTPNPALTPLHLIASEFRVPLNRVRLHKWHLSMHPKSSLCSKFEFRRQPNIRNSSSTQNRRNPKSPSAHLTRNLILVVNPKSPSSHLTENRISSSAQNRRRLTSPKI